MLESKLDIGFLKQLITNLPDDYQVLIEQSDEYLATLVINSDADHEIRITNVTFDPLPGPIE